MTLNQWSYLGIIVGFAVVFIGLIFYYFNSKRYEKIEKPKYRIIDTESDNEHKKDDS